LVMSLLEQYGARQKYFQTKNFLLESSSGRVQVADSNL